MAVLDWLSSRAARLADRRVLVASGTVWAGLAAVLFVWPGRFSLAAVADACGRQAPDVRFAPAAAQTQSFLAGCGARGLATYRDLQIVDLFYPMAGALFLVAVLGLLLPRVAPRLTWLAVLPLVAAVGDYVENAAAWALLAAGTATTGNTPSAGAQVLQLGSAVKVVTSWASWLTVTALLLAFTVGVLARGLRARRRSGDQPADHVSATRA